MFAGRVAVRVKVPTGKAPSLSVLVLLVTGVVLILKGILVPAGKFDAPATLKATVRVLVAAGGGTTTVSVILIVRFSVAPEVMVKLRVLVPVTL